MSAGGHSNCRTAYLAFPSDVVENVIDGLFCVIASDVALRSGQLVLIC
jgi:hypothetical protein